MSKIKSLKDFIEYRNMLISKKEARHVHGLLPFNGNPDYYTKRLEYIDRKYSQFKGLGRIKLK